MKVSKDFMLLVFWILVGVGFLCIPSKIIDGINDSIGMIILFFLIVGTLIISVSSETKLPPSCFS